MSTAKALRKRRRSFGVNLMAFFRIRTMIGNVPMARSGDPWRTSIAASRSATLGDPNRPDTKQAAGVPLAASCSWSVSVAGPVAVVRNWTLPVVGVAFRKLTGIGPASPPASRTRTAHGEGAQVT